MASTGRSRRTPRPSRRPDSPSNACARSPTPILSGRGSASRCSSTSSPFVSQPAVRDSLPAASAAFASLPPAREDAGALRESIRAMRAADDVLVGVIDDDPTGSQAVHGVQVVTVPDEDACAAGFGGPAGTCFLLTNSRSVGERAAAELTENAARCLAAAARRLGAGVELVSRSDSTLRGHVLAEVAALSRARR